MEYMAFGLPFVAFDLTETRALAGGAAAYAEPADVRRLGEQVDRVLDDPDLRRAMGQEGRRRIESEVAWDHQEPAYLDVYRSLLGPPRTIAPTLPRAAQITNVAV
ncbi:MAG: glycosyltransferase [Jatrophihabitantaceae bacterium]